jgi:hypothetical protein
MLDASNLTQCGTIEQTVQSPMTGAPACRNTSRGRRIETGACVDNLTCLGRLIVIAPIDPRIEAMYATPMPVVAGFVTLFDGSSDASCCRHEAR